MPVIDMKGVWSAARNTQAEVHEVNRPGYQGAPRVAAASVRRTRAKAEPVAQSAPVEQKTE